MNDREKLPYTTAFILETLRFYPIVPVGLPHKTACDTEAGELKEIVILTEECKVFIAAVIITNR